jgi:hypothetical protein
MKILKILKLQNEIDFDENNIDDEIQILKQVKKRKLIFSFLFDKILFLFSIFSYFLINNYVNTLKNIRR